MQVGFGAFPREPVPIEARGFGVSGTCARPGVEGVHLPGLALPGVSSRVGRSGPTHLVGGPSEDEQGLLGGVGQIGGGKGCHLLYADPTLPILGPGFLVCSADVSHLLPGSLEGRGSSAPSRVATRNSPLDRLEPDFLGDSESSPQEEPPDGPLEPWGSDGSCPSPVLRDEVDSIFPDFFAC